MHKATMIAAAFSLSVFVSIPVAHARGFLREQSVFVETIEQFGGELQVALSEVMGCGGEGDSIDLAIIENKLQPMWRTLPKNKQGRVEWRSLRYITHRYFMSKSSLMIRGFEPLRPVSTSDAGILSRQIPAYVDMMLGGEHAKKGFSLQDSAYLVATLEQLIFDSETHLLERVYKELHEETKRVVPFQRLKEILEAYMVFWMMGDDREGIDILMANRTLLEEAFPHWFTLKDFVSGRLKMLNFERAHKPATGGSKVLMQKYSFDDAHQVVGGITRTFQSFWESECESMKTSLVALDKGKTGRVLLSDFYREGMKEEWRFGESEAYLREMGVLDESAHWHGKQVIISNYLQASSNCIVAAPHYSVCCSNPCEGIFADIENEVAAPMAVPNQIFQLIQNMTNEDDEPIKLGTKLIKQLKSIAEQYGGKVPIHGRLFQQWLHYVFPNECTFPHKAGTVSIASPTEFGDNYIASEEEMKHHAKINVNHNASIHDLHMSQWSEEEELFADYSSEMELTAPWESKRHVTMVLVGTLVFFGAVLLWTILGLSGKRGLELPISAKSMGKSHWV